MNKVTDSKQSWEEYAAQELRAVTPILKALGFTLDEAQVHTSGERYLMSGRKLVLLGTRDESGGRVVVKVSSDESGIKELEHEHSVHETIPKINFAYRPFRIPQEILFTCTQGFVISVTQFIGQTDAFLKHPLEEQFFLAMMTFEMQEGIQATTFEHAHVAREAFRFLGAHDYVALFKNFATSVLANELASDNLKQTVREAETFYGERSKHLELYCGFLTHDDFVPHNLRVQGRAIYLLDYTSLHFGNKYESWARFINYMVLYNRPLEKALLEYVLKNRGEKEVLNLRIMRVHKLMQLIHYYASTLEKTSGNLQELSLARLEFWRQVLEATLKDEPVSDAIVDSYKTTRDRLRSDEEKARQREMSQLL